MNKISRIFVVQDQYMRDQETGALVSKFDFTKAKEFGELKFLLAPNANPFSPNQAVVKELTDKLQDFDDADYLLLTGNPILIGWATALAALANDGKIKMLQWNPRRQCYLEVRGNLFEFIDGGPIETLVEPNGNR